MPTKLIALTAILTFICLYDIKERRIPNLLIVLGCALSILARHGEEIWLSIACGLAVFVLLFVLSLVMRIGTGDVKLGLLVGMAPGWYYGFYAFILGIMLAGFFSLFLLKTKRAKSNSLMPCGPFLALGTWLILLINLWNPHLLSVLPP